MVQVKVHHRHLTEHRRNVIDLEDVLFGTDAQRRTGSSSVGEAGRGKRMTEENTHDPWFRRWFILNTMATIAGALTGLVALIIAVIALTS